MASTWNFYAVLELEDCASDPNVAESTCSSTITNSPSKPRRARSSKLIGSSYASLTKTETALAADLEKVKRRRRRRNATKRRTLEPRSPCNDEPGSPSGPPPPPPPPSPVEVCVQSDLPCPRCSTAGSSRYHLRPRPPPLQLPPPVVTDEGFHLFSPMNAMMALLTSLLPQTPLMPSKAQTRERAAQRDRKMAQHDGPPEPPPPRTCWHCKSVYVHADPDGFKNWLKTHDCPSRPKGSHVGPAALPLTNAAVAAKAVEHKPLCNCARVGNRHPCRGGRHIFYWKNGAQKLAPICAECYTGLPCDYTDRSCLHPVGLKSARFRFPKPPGASHAPETTDLRSVFQRWRTNGSAQTLLATDVDSDGRINMPEPKDDLVEPLCGHTVSRTTPTLYRWPTSPATIILHPHYDFDSFDSFVDVNNTYLAPQVNWHGSGSAMFATLALEEGLGFGCEGAATVIPYALVTPGTCVKNSAGVDHYIVAVRKYTDADGNSHVVYGFSTVPTTKPRPVIARSADGKSYYPDVVRLAQQGINNRKLDMAPDNLESTIRAVCIQIVRAHSDASSYDYSLVMNSVLQAYARSLPTFKYTRAVLRPDYTWLVVGVSVALLAGVSLVGRLRGGLWTFVVDKAKESVQAQVAQVTRAVTQANTVPELLRRQVRVFFQLPRTITLPEPLPAPPLYSSADLIQKATNLLIALTPLTERAYHLARDFGSSVIATMFPDRPIMLTDADMELVNQMCPWPTETTAPLTAQNAGPASNSAASVDNGGHGNAPLVWVSDQAHGEDGSLVHHTVSVATDRASDQPEPTTDPEELQWETRSDTPTDWSGDPSDSESTTSDESVVDDAEPPTSGSATGAGSWFSRLRRLTAGCQWPSCDANRVHRLVGEGLIAFSALHTYTRRRLGLTIGLDGSLIAPLYFATHLINKQHPGVPHMSDLFALALPEEIGKRIISKVTFPLAGALILTVYEAARSRDSPVNALKRLVLHSVLETVPAVVVATSLHAAANHIILVNRDNRATLILTAPSPDTFVAPRSYPGVESTCTMDPQTKEKCWLQANPAPWKQLVHRDQMIQIGPRVAMQAPIVCNPSPNNMARGMNRRAMADVVTPFANTGTTPRQLRQNLKKVWEFVEGNWDVFFPAQPVERLSYEAFINRVDVHGVPVFPAAVREKYSEALAAWEQTGFNFNHAWNTVGRCSSFTKRELQMKGSDTKPRIIINTDPLLNVILGSYVQAWTKAVKTVWTPDHILLWSSGRTAEEIGQYFHDAYYAGGHLQEGDVAQWDASMTGPYIKWFLAKLYTKLGMPRDVVKLVCHASEMRFSSRHWRGFIYEIMGSGRPDTTFFNTCVNAMLNLYLYSQADPHWRTNYRASFAGDDSLECVRVQDPQKAQKFATLFCLKLVPVYPRTLIEATYCSGTFYTAEVQGRVTHVFGPLIGRVLRKAGHSISTNLGEKFDRVLAYGISCGSAFWLPLLDQYYAALRFVGRPHANAHEESKLKRALRDKRYCPVVGPKVRADDLTLGCCLYRWGPDFAAASQHLTDMLGPLRDCVKRFKHGRLVYPDISVDMMSYLDGGDPRPPIDLHCEGEPVHVHSVTSRLIRGHLGWLRI